MISENRTKHIIAVANLMREKAKLLNLNEDDMFLLGYLHDVGYFKDETLNHGQVGEIILTRNGYKYAKEILYHGNPNADYSSVELDLLNYCDMHIDGTGRLVSFEERLLDIKTRHGEDSLAYQNSKAVAEKLKQKHFLGE